jgi:hypothetical protein
MPVKRDFRVRQLARLCRQGSTSCRAEKDAAERATWESNPIVSNILLLSTPISPIPKDLPVKASAACVGNNSLLSQLLLVDCRQELEVFFDLELPQPYVLPFGCYRS